MSTNKCIACITLLTISLHVSFFSGLTILSQGKFLQPLSATFKMKDDTQYTKRDTLPKDIHGIRYKNLHKYF